VIYRADLTDDLRLDASLIYSHNFEISNFENPGDPSFENRVLGELGDPQDEFRLDAGLSFGAGHLRLWPAVHRTDGRRLWENYNPLGRADAAERRRRGHPRISGGVLPRRALELDLGDQLGSRRPAIGRDFIFYSGVDNVTNTKPPLGSTGAGAGAVAAPTIARVGQLNGAIYDVRGRQVYLGFRAGF
jgi:hypothetical protein